MKGIEICEHTVTIRSAMKPETGAELERLAEELLTVEAQ